MEPGQRVHAAPLGPGLHSTAIGVPIHPPVTIEAGTVGYFLMVGDALGLYTSDEAGYPAELVRWWRLTRDGYRTVVDAPPVPPELLSQ